MQLAEKLKQGEWKMSPNQMILNKIVIIFIDGTKQKKKQTGIQTEEEKAEEDGEDDEWGGGD